MKTLVALLTAAACALSIAYPGAVPAQDTTPRAEHARLGALALEFDATRWRFMHDNGSSSSIRLELLLQREQSSGITVSISAKNDAVCTPAAMLARATTPTQSGWRPRKAETLHTDTLTIHYTRSSNPCRNLVGSPVQACVAHGGVNYLIDTHGGYTCFQGPGLDRTILSMLQGLSIHNDK